MGSPNGTVDKVFRRRPGSTAPVVRPGAYPRISCWLSCSMGSAPAGRRCWEPAALRQGPRFRDTRA